ncbi:MAG: TetR/AcrR family transcriptional regulator [Kofleriaceae bacterium]|nr:MAG: TetR/AcrR family transcriptional regulator [Kofleriaceae bacterium]MBZ0239001.1 TetR/AcrR family transcriptional regulator [Kofleriaceae bacterium]
MTVPVRAPRTQAQRRDETRRALLDAAVESLVEHGFAGTTTLEVQKKAGVSRGALLHHFPSKAELLVATIAHLAEMRGRDLKQRSSALPTGPARVEAVLELIWECFNGPLFQVGMELRAAARTEPELKGALTAAERDVHTKILTQAAALFGHEIAARPGFEAAMELTLHLMMGAAMTTLLHNEPRIQSRINQWKTLFPSLLEKTS